MRSGQIAGAGKKFAEESAAWRVGKERMALQLVRALHRLEDYIRHDKP